MCPFDASRLTLWLLGLATVTSVTLAESDATIASPIVSFNATETEEDGVTFDHSPLMFASPMKNFTKISGESLKLKCEVRGFPPASNFRWFKDEAPLMEERGRIRIRSRTGSGDVQVSRVVFQSLNTMDTGFYRCEASNGISVTHGESMVKVHRGGAGSGRKKTDLKPDPDDDDEAGEDHFGKTNLKFYVQV